MKSNLKYFSHSFTNAYGKWDSKFEFTQYLSMLEKQKRGEIQGLRRQTSITIVPKLTKIIKKQLKIKVKDVEQTEEMAKRYTPDFAYFSVEHQCYVLHEIKSVATMDARDYHMRRHLCKIGLCLHNIFKGRKTQWAFAETLNNNGKTTFSFTKCNRTLFLDIARNRQWKEALSAFIRTDIENPAPHGKTSEDSLF